MVNWDRTSILCDIKNYNKMSICCKYSRASYNKAKELNMLEEIKSFYNKWII